MGDGTMNTYDWGIHSDGTVTIYSSKSGIVSTRKHFNKLQSKKIINRLESIDDYGEEQEAIGDIFSNLADWE